MKNEIRVKIDEDKQKEIFVKFINKFKKDFSKASEYLEIPNSRLSRYKRAITRYMPEYVLMKVVDYLKIEKPRILERGTLKEIRINYMHKAHPILKEKYGENWAKELTNRREFKGISLKDFPDYIFIYLEDGYRERLFRAAFNLAGNPYKLSKMLNVWISTLLFWYEGKQKNYKKNEVMLQYIPLPKLKLISKLLTEDHNLEFSMENIEKYVIMYRMRSGSPIKNPKFPIKESPEMIRLLFHLLGDGYSGNKRNSANYRNTCSELLDEFKQDLKIFGDVPIYEQQYSIKFPRVIAEIIENFYKVTARTFEGEISDIILKVPKRWLCEGIKAFVDDEGCVCKSSIMINLANYKLLDGIKQILDYLKIRRSEIRPSTNPNPERYTQMYYLYIHNLELYKKLIGCSHPKKREKLDKYVRKKKTKRRKRLLKLKP